MNTVHSYPRARVLVSVIAPDLLLVLLLLVLLLRWSGGAWAMSMTAAIAVALGWGIATLHFPSKVALGASGVTFFGYGRAHAFAWQDVKVCRVRRFLVKDRVLVRIGPAPPWRGRYWILDGIGGFDDLVRGLESRDATLPKPTTSTSVATAATRLPK